MLTGIYTPHSISCNERSELSIVESHKEGVKDTKIYKFHILIAVHARLNNFKGFKAVV